MMMELSTIIGISVGGGLALLLLIVIVVYCACRKRRSSDSGNELKNQRDSNGRGYVPTDSLPPTLPKVGSNGLWIPSQSMLSAAPSSAYSHAKPNNKPRDILYRATSEPRVADGPDSARGYPGNLRIYHSQQLAPLFEVYEPGRYDRYLGMPPSNSSLFEDDRMYHSQSMLIENGYQPRHVYEKEVDDRRVRRSASDVSSNPKAKQRGQRGPPGDRAHPYQDKNFSAVVEVHQPRQVPVRSYWGPNRGPNKERQVDRPRSKPSAGDGRSLDYIQDNTLTRQTHIPPNQYPGSSSTWDPGMSSHPSAGAATTTIYYPETRDSHTTSSIGAYQDQTDDNFQLDLMTNYSSQSSSKPASVDQGVQVSPEEAELVATSANNTVSSKHTDMDEDGGYFTSSGRTDLIPYSKEDKNSIPSPYPDVDVASDVTDLASKGKHVTAEAFQFLETYLSDDEQSAAVG